MLIKQKNYWKQALILANCSPLYADDLHIIAQHRNALQTWSVDLVLITAGYNVYNYVGSKTYVDDQIEVELGVFAIYLGDLIIDENLGHLDIGLIETDIYNFAFGYLATGINGDGNMDLLESAPVEINLDNFIFSIHA